MYQCTKMGVPVQVPVQACDYSQQYYSMIQWFNFSLDEQGLQNTNNNGPLTWLLEAKLPCDEYEQIIIVGTMVIMIHFNSRDEALPHPPPSPIPQLRSINNYEG